LARQFWLAGATEEAVVTATPRDLYERYASAVAYLAVERTDGRQSIGSAFHVGEGVFLTARHVVEGRQIREIATTVHRYVEDPVGNLTFDGREGRFRGMPPSAGKLRSGPHFHPDSAVDVAALVVDGIDAPVIPLGSHLDDLLNDEAFVLRRVLAMGYPPVPLSKRPVLIAASAEVNAVIDPYVKGHPHFILSSMARGGFSGGPCLVEWNFALGLITNAFTSGDEPVELGYMGVISVEPLLVCLHHNGILPAVQKEGWDDFWDRDDEVPEPTPG
jgi:hypothetical protein